MEEKWRLWPWTFLSTTSMCTTVDFRLLWNWTICAENFHHFVYFSQHIGFEFSESEPSALVQRQGGPCAVIAPVQAFLLKTILLETDSQNLSSVSSQLIYPMNWTVERACMQALCNGAKMCHSLHAVLWFDISANVHFSRFTYQLLRWNFLLTFPFSLFLSHSIYALQCESHPHSFHVLTLFIVNFYNMDIWIVLLL